MDIRNGKDAAEYIKSWEAGEKSLRRVRWIVQVALEGQRMCLGLIKEQDSALAEGHKEAIKVFERYLEQTKLTE